ncbi:MAG: hypothetical protein LBM93_14420 [Oscillospiraceae bacterium]|jgi:hypothetical protein|nr:hypothetical protein [Oscillospiraceae bacterium]
MESKTISYHDFIFPFSFEDEFSPTNNWLVKNDKDYTTEKYFTSPARKLIYEQKHYLFIKENLKYHIQSKKKKFILNVKNIRLNIYEKTKVGILIFELENTKYARINDINKINEQVRRISLPFLGAQESDDLVAQKLILEGEDFFIEEDFKENKDVKYISKTITEIIGLLKIKPIMDDRMFVHCLYKNKQLIRKSKKRTDKNNYDYLMKNSLQQDLYKLFYIENNLTCQNEDLIKDILRRTTYDRWIECGTLYSLTHHSFVCLTTEDAPEVSVVRPFLTVYLEMSIMAILQRASILYLSKEAASHSDKKNREIIKLNKNNIEIQNEFVLSEVTLQEQGIEIFNMLRKELFIEGSNKELTEQLSLLNQKVEREVDKVENCVLSVIAIFGGAWALIELGRFILGLIN